jgi:hypothetical protein
MRAARVPRLMRSMGERAVTSSESRLGGAGGAVLRETAQKGLYLPIRSGKVQDKAGAANIKQELR